MFKSYLSILTIAMTCGFCLQVHAQDRFESLRRQIAEAEKSGADVSTVPLLIDLADDSDLSQSQKVNLLRKALKLAIAYKGDESGLTAECRYELAFQSGSKTRLL